MAPRLGSSTLPPRPIDDFSCQSEGCDLRGKPRAGNLTFRGWSGRSKTIRMIYCRACGARFSERKGTALSYAHLPEDRVRAVLEHLRRGQGVRATARLAGVDKNTVLRYAKLAPDKRAALLEKLRATNHPR